jgi:predicted RNase H-like nuclease (RuvC/YqgF family)
MVKTKNVIILIVIILTIAAITSLVFYINFALYKGVKEAYIEKLEAENGSLQDEVKELQKKLKESQNNLNKTESNLNIVNTKIKTTEAVLAETKESLEITQTALRIAQSDMEYWKNKYSTSNPGNVTYSYEFTTVNALIAAIKSNPEAYHNKKVKVFGMIFTYESDNKKEFALIDYKGEELSYSYDFKARLFKNEKIEAKEAIDVTLSSDLQYTVAETGDYVNLYGTVKITNGEIYLDKCQYN